MARYDEPSPLEITLSGTFNQETREGNLHVNIHAIDPITWEGMKVRIALTEDSLYYVAPNGTRYHNCTMRDMIPTPTGRVLSIAQGETVEFDQAFTVASQLVLAQCKIVVWVQADNSDYEVLQAAKDDLLGLDPVGVDDDITQLPQQFDLAQNYPNPFNASTTIDFTLSSESQVELEVYDLVGRKVAQLVTGVQPAGYHQITWDGVESNGRAVASGIYFYRLTAEGQSLTKRMMLLK